MSTKGPGVENSPFERIFSIEEDFSLQSWKAYPFKYLPKLVSY